MSDAVTFAAEIGLVGLALLLALGSSRITEALGIPAPAIFLVVAAVAAELFGGLSHLGVRDNQRLVTVALTLILFDGGMHIGWRRLRPVAGAVVWVGIAGTLVTAAAMALLAHGLFGFAWRPALLIGTALAPTDPAVVFSVLGRREIRGRSGTLLEGESGANDPVGIALMISVLGAGSGWGAVGGATGQFLLQLGVGLVVGVAGGWVIGFAMRRVRLPARALYPLEGVALALVVYGVAGAAHGSGFLAVFVAGILVGDVDYPRRRDVTGFVRVLGSLGEIVAFVVLGLSISLHEVASHGRIWTGLGLAVLLILVVRPLAVGAVLAPVRLSRGERGFVLWAGLKGAVPILLATFALSQHAPAATRIYDVVFVVVTVSVIVQGGLVPLVARWFRVPMR